MLKKTTKNTRSKLKTKINNNKYILFTILLLTLNFSSGLATIYIRHLNRTSMAELQGLINKQDLIYQEWTQLLLEQSTLTSYNRVDKIANNDLSMHAPNRHEIELIVRHIK